jgi:hypothetical protein
VSFDYVPYHELGEAENIVVDGAPNKSTVLTLSHWPGSDTPAELKADTSAEIVFKYLRCPHFTAASNYVTNNHFDEDGLIGLYSMLNPEDALMQEDLLTDIASAGDFGVYKDREAARISFVLSAWTDPVRSPLNQSVFDSPYPVTTQILYEELLPRLEKIIENIVRFEDFWGEEDAHLTASEEAIRSGEVAIEEITDLDLAVVTIAPLANEKDEERMAIDKAVHAMAIHGATPCTRVLLCRGRNFRYYDRYETWVQFTSRKTPARIDLSPLAAELSALEKNGAQWHYDGIDDIIPKLKMSGATRSIITREQMLEKLTSYLRRQQPQ